MAFTDTDAVYAHLGIDSDAVSTSLVEQSITEAHADVLRDLRDEYESSEDATLKQAETELASSCLFRILAGQAAVQESEIQTPMLKIAGAKKVEDLLHRADAEARRGRARLEPFLVAVSERFEFGTVEGSASSDQENG